VLQLIREKAFDVLGVKARRVRNLMQKQEYMHLLMENTTILLYRHLLFVKEPSPSEGLFPVLVSG